MVPPAGVVADMEDDACAVPDMGDGASVMADMEDDASIVPDM